MEKNGVTKAKKAKSVSKKLAKKATKQKKKENKKAEKRERKDIKKAYMKALKKQNTEKMLSIFAIVLEIIPIALEAVVDKIDSKKGGSENE